ncbi:MAG: hypothetical protein FWD44_02675 [Oscillospiraceae bacterium]|nr:hypothetical protein [Oscillospiraceae bacterium]
MKPINTCIKILLMIFAVILIIPAYASSLMGAAASSALPKNRVVFSPSTSIDTLEYAGEASFEAQLLDLRSKKPVIEIYNTTHLHYDLSVSYTPFRVGDEINNDIKFAVLDKIGDTKDNHGNMYRVFEPGISQSVYISPNDEIISKIPWNEGSEDLLKIYLPSYRHDLDSKNIQSTLTWLLEVTPTPTDIYHTWDEWSPWSLSGDRHVRSRSCSVCGFIGSEFHMAAGSQSPWQSGGDGCQRICTVYGCGLQTATHGTHLSGWIDNDDGTWCRIECLTCSRLVRQSVHAWGAWQSDNQATHSAKCDNCGRTETAEHPWNNWSIWTLHGGNHIMTRSCGTCSESETLYHAATAFESAWHEGGHGCQTTCTLTGCGLQTATHGISHSGWHSGGSGCLTVCNLCNRHTQTHATTWGNWGGWFTSENDCTRNGSCTICGRGGGSQSHTTAWGNWGNWLASGTDCQRTGMCTTCGRSGGSQSHATTWGNWSAWSTSGSNCVSSGTCTTCGRSGGSSSHTTNWGNWSTWSASGSNCLRTGTCTTCERSGGSQSHATNWGNWSAWSPSGSNHVRTGRCTTCTRSGGSQSHAISWSAYSSYVLYDYYDHVRTRQCNGTNCNVTESQTQNHNLQWYRSRITNGNSSCLYICVTGSCVYVRGSMAHTNPCTRCNMSPLPARYTQAGH